MKFYTTVKLGPNSELTPEGFVLYKDVSVARIGWQIYGPKEVEGIEPGDDGMVHIFRSPEEVFRPKTLASLNGKSYVILHPEDDVKPENWKDLSHGVWMNARRGSGEQKDDMVADLLVTTPEGIMQAQMTPEISLGYDADYYRTGPGKGEQRNIIINHGAAVPQGRCGHSCAVKDHAPETTSMKGKSFRDRILAAFKTKDEDEVKKVMDEMEEEGESGGSEHHVHVHLPGAAEGASPKVEDNKEEDPTEKRFKGIEDGMKEIRDCLTKFTEGSSTAKPAKVGDENPDDEPEDDVEDEMSEEAEEGEAEHAKKSKDSAFLQASFDRTTAAAEIIAPGVKIPTFDAKANPKKTFKDCICGLRRTALRAAIKDAETAELVEQVRGRTTDAAAINSMKSGQVRTLFNGVAALKSKQNNAGVLRTADHAATAGAAKTNDAMAKFKAASAKRWSAKK